MLIQDTTVLAESCAKLSKSRAIGVDTEFIRERTYRAKLCLVQLSASEGEIFCVDTLKTQDLSPLRDLFEQSKPLFIFHAARQDIEVLAQSIDVVPENIYDTQLAAAFCGFGDQLSYANLVKRICDVNLEKLETRTDWTRRPLSERQIAYAMEDVRYLLPIFNSLAAELVALGRTNWLEEELNLLGEPAQYLPSPEHAWRRVRGHGSLTDSQRGRLRTLAAWREITADGHDLPREWVVKDRALINLAKLESPTLSVIGDTKDLSPKQSSRWGLAILNAINTKSDHGQIPGPMRMTSAQEKLRKRLMNYLRARTEAMHLSTSLVGSRRDVEALILGQHESALLSGWRRSMIGDELLQVLDGMQRGE